MLKLLLAIACLAAGALAQSGADAASNVVQYVYDAAGNIVAIQRIDPASIPVTEFEPTTGTAGPGAPAVPPGGVVPADIIATARLSADGPAQGLGLFVTGKYGWILFDVAAGAWMSLHIGNFTVTPAEATMTYTIYRPDNAQLATGTLSATNLSIHLPALPAAGTYSLLLRTGIAQGSLDARLETNRFVPADGTTLAVARSSGQSTRALIAGVTGDQKALMVSGLVTTPVGNALDVTIALPNGSTFHRTNAAGLGTTTALPPFTVTGTHPVTLVPSTVTMQAAFKVGLVGNVGVAADGAPADVAIANPGDGARLTFPGLAGENLGLGVSGVVLNPASAAATIVSVYRPDASLLATVTCGIDGTRCASNLENLPVTGTYTLIVQPTAGATGTQRVWLSRDVSGTLISGTPLNVALSRPGQNARLTFAGTAGHTLRLTWSAVAIAGAPGTAFVRIHAPSGVALGGGLFAHGSSGSYDIPALPANGNYAVFVDPPGAAALSATFGLVAR